MPRERKYTPATEDARDYVEDFTTVVDGGGRPMHAHFGEWVADKTGAEDYFKTKKELDAFALGAQFGIRYRMDYQAAVDGAHAFHDDARAAREQEAAARPKRTPKAAPADEDEDEAPAPKRRGRPRKVVEPEDEAPPARPARRGRPPKAAAAADTGESAVKAAARRPAATGRPGRPARRTSKAQVGTIQEADF